MAALPPSTPHQIEMLGRPAALQSSCLRAHRTLRRRYFLRHNLGAERELAILDRDHRHTLLGHVAVDEADLASYAGEVFGSLERLLNRGRVGGAGALERIGQ